MPDYTKFISQCSKKLAPHVDAGGAVHKLETPLLSIYFGEEVQRFRPNIEQAYQECWQNALLTLRALDETNYNAETVIKYVNQMCANRGAFYNPKVVVLAYYWDIMDDAFEEFFAKLQQKAEFPAAVTVSEMIFIFCREAEVEMRKKRETRLKKLIAWAQQDGRHLLILTDNTDLGLLDDETIAENYRIAADVVQIAATHPNPGEKNLGQALRFDLNKSTLFGLGYYTVGKDTEAIAKVSLYQMLEEYGNMAKLPTDDGNVRARICDGEDYQALLDDLFEQKLEVGLPQNVEFLRTMPYTEAMQNCFEQKASSGKSFGWFGHSKQAPTPSTISQQALETAIQSSPIYKATFEKYYHEPVQVLIESEEGKRAICSFFQERLSTALGYIEMRDYLQNEVAELDRVIRENSWKKLDLERAPWQQVMDRFFRCRLRGLYYTTLAELLQGEMSQISRAAVGFEDTLRKVKNNLNVDSVDAGIRKAYSKKMQELAKTKRAFLMGRIHPSDEDQLLEQLEATFGELIEGEAIYHYTLEEDLNFQISNGGAAATAHVVQDCMAQPMTNTRHLQTYTVPTGSLYCMLSSDAQFALHIDPLLHGEIFKTQRSDCIERLIIYPVQANDIIW